MRLSATKAGLVSSQLLRRPRLASTISHRKILIPRTPFWQTSMTLSGPRLLFFVRAFGEELLTDQPAQVQESLEPPAAAQQRTQMAYLTEEELERLAEARTNKDTIIQTKWGVKILAGNCWHPSCQNGYESQSECGFSMVLNCIWTLLGWDSGLRNVILKL